MEQICPHIKAKGKPEETTLFAHLNDVATVIEKVADYLKREEKLLLVKLSFRGIVWESYKNTILTPPIIKNQRYGLKGQTISAQWQGLGYITIYNQ
jgi:hypothetical protein